MSALQRNLPIILAAVLSALLHVFVLFPAIGILGLGSARDDDGLVRSGLDGDEGDAADGSDDAEELDRAKLEEEIRSRERAALARRAMQERVERDRERPLEEREEKVHLGIDRSTAVTMNWIGYDEYEEHLAERAEFEQAAFRLQASSGSEGTASPLLPPAEPAPTPAASPNPSELPLPAANAGASGTPGATSIASAATASAEATTPAATPSSAPTEPSARRGDDAESARPLQPPEMPAPPSGATSEGAPIPEVAEEGVLGPAPASTVERPTDRPEPAEPSTAPVEADPVRPANGIQPAPPVEDPSRTDPNAPPVEDPSVEDPLIRPDPSKGDPLEPRDPATPGPDPKAIPRDAADPTVEPSPVPGERREPEPSRTDEPRTAEDDATQGESTGEEGGGAPENATEGGGVVAPQPVDGSANTSATPAPAGARGESTAKPGEVSDRESDATSIIDVPAAMWRNGRPLAAKGVVLKPVRPRFTALDYVDGIARNPIGELVLGRDGIPQVARLIRSTGNPRIDEAIRNALFKWRATGEALDKLQPGQTVTIRLRLVMLQD